MSYFPTAAEEAERLRMIYHAPLYDVVRRVSEYAIVLRNRGTQRETIWVISKAGSRLKHECVVCRKVFVGVRMYRPPVGHQPGGERVCEGCASMTDHATV